MSSVVLTEEIVRALYCASGTECLQLDKIMRLSDFMDSDEPPDVYVSEDTETFWFDWGGGHLSLAVGVSREGNLLYAVYINGDSANGSFPWDGKGIPPEVDQAVRKYFG